MKAIMQCLGGRGRSPWTGLALIVSLLTGSAAFAEEDSLKQGAKRAGHTAGTVVREIGQGAKQVGKEIGQGAKEAGKTVGEAAKAGGKEFRKAVKGN